LVIGSKDEVDKEIAGMFNCKVGEFPLNYLGLRIRPGKLHEEDQFPIINKADTKLARWKGSSLSKAGRLVLVNSMLSALALYWLSFYKCPIWVLKKIDAFRRNLFWTRKKNTSALSCLISWDPVCKSFEQGGLGIIDLKVMNSSLLCKWLWNMMNHRNAIWIEWIINAYYSGAFSLHAD
jgi:hypothetical protein